ncbi:MAG: sigma-70 family RNA polymerase sigma factor [Planctomyces sp.]|nr:sigma-70 family RNA polymerase sigma factor [Planctomyces sp.]
MQDNTLIALVRAAQQGDAEAFGALAREFESSVYGVVMRRLRNSAEAAEVTQDVFLRAFRKLNQLREPERFVGWLKRIAVRLSINRATRRPNESIQPPELFDSRQHSPDQPLDRMLRRERANEVREGLSQLKPLDRDTLIAFYFEGRSLKELSVRYDSPVGTIKRRLHTARNRLRAAMSEFQPV